MIGGLLGVLKFLQDIANIRLRRRDGVIEAIVALRTAIRETRTQIGGGGYTPNRDISDLWLNAYKAFQKARMKNRMLYDKARFWEDPQRWIREPGSLELIPTLDALEQECENLLARIH